MSGIEISVEVREVAAGDVHPNTVPLFEYQTGRKHLHRYGIDLVRLHEFRSFPRFIPISHSKDSIREANGLPIGVHVDQLHQEIRIRGRG